MTQPKTYTQHPPRPETTVTELNTSRIQELEDIYYNLNPAQDLKQHVIELYYLRDYAMRLNLMEQIRWCTHKLEYRTPHLRQELLRFEGTSDNIGFYNACTLDELVYLGY
jgi:hypothetical protein